MDDKRNSGSEQDRSTSEKDTAQKHGLAKNKVEINKPEAGQGIIPEAETSRRSLRTPSRPSTIGSNGSGSGSSQDNISNNSSSIPR